jgi:2-dehydro-3-deoxyphosphooctonate aldolase (KDO 8-P synthase)
MNLTDQIPGIRSYQDKLFLLIAGPCVIEDERSPFEIAETLAELADKYSLPFVFKASYRKANRSRIDSFTGIGDLAALEVLKAVSEKYKIPVITDVHSEEDIEMAIPYVDIFQIPAFLCRQTSLLQAAGHSGKPVNIKKGQFLSADAMRFALEKVLQTGNKKVMLTERGSMYGYNDLVVDFRSIPTMKSFGVPVILDVTHSLQQPNQGSGITGGMPEMIETIAKAGIACGVDGIFLETHPRPEIAKSDGANMLLLSKVEKLLEKLVRIKRAAW